MIFCSRFGGKIRGGYNIRHETFSVCVHMSRNVVVSFSEGNSDDMDDKKIGGYMIFRSGFRGGGG